LKRRAGETEESRRVLKAYPVFNADQVDGLPERFHPAAALELVEPAGRAGADLRPHSGRASPPGDEALP
jgi:antirestriction protein ArdC